MAFGDKPFGLKELKVAPLNADGTYGTAVALPEGRKLVMAAKTVTSKLPGYLGATAAVATVVQDVEVTIDGGTVPKEFLAAVLGLSVTTGGVTPNQTKALDLEVKKPLPYFGVIGVAVDDDGGDTHFGLPKVKLTELPEWTAQNEDNLFVMSSMKGLAIADEAGKAIYLLSHETAEAADFTTLFA